MSHRSVLRVCLTAGRGESRYRVNGASSARNGGMGHQTSRRCALWVSPEVLADAQELADLLAVDVDTFIESVVVALHDQEALEGRLRARAEVAKKSANGDLISIAAHRTNRQRRRV